MFKVSVSVTVHALCETSKRFWFDLPGAYENPFLYYDSSLVV